MYEAFGVCVRRGNVRIGRQWGKEMAEQHFIRKRGVGMYLGLEIGLGPGLFLKALARQAYKLSLRILARDTYPI